MACVGRVDLDFEQPGGPRVLSEQPSDFALDLPRIAILLLTPRGYRR